MCGSAPTPPAPDPRMYEIMDKQVNMSQEALDFFKGVTVQNQGRQQKMDDLSGTLVADYLDTSKTAKARGDEAYKFYQTAGRPVEQAMLRDAMQADSPERVALDRGRAMADVTQAFSAARDQSGRSLTRMGINPNSGRFAALNNQLINSEALAGATAGTNAATGARDRGVALRAGAANFVRGMPNTVAGFTGQGMQAGGAAQSSLAGANTGFNQNAQIAGGGFQTAGGMMGQAANTATTINGQALQAWGMGQQAAAQEGAGFGQLAGLLGSAMITKFADGGVVQGPGTGTSDSVPAVNQQTGQPIQLSSGEYVVPADVVKRKGVEFFDKLVRQHHTPVRQAIPMGA